MSLALSSIQRNRERKSGLRILVAAGGSGGHVFPAIALARALMKKKSDIDIKFVGSNKALDRRILEKESFRFSLLTANNLPYKAPLRLFGFFLKFFIDIVKALVIVVSYRPDVVVGFGGYISCPITLAAYPFRIPTIMHEQNVVPGRANRLLFKLADTIAISFNETKRFISGPDLKKIVFTGNPIRQEAFKNDRDFGIKCFGLDKTKFTILVIGGSQGAHFLNEVVTESLSGLDKSVKSSLQVIHITGIKDYRWAIKMYEGLGMDNRVYSFIDRIEDAYSASDLIVTRSGASAVFEIAFFAKPMILVPYPFAMSHQAENARAFSTRGAAIEIDEKILTAELFRKIVSDLINNKMRLKGLSESAKRLSVPEAADNLAEEVLKLRREKDVGKK